MWDTLPGTVTNIKAVSSLENRIAHDALIRGFFGVIFMNPNIILYPDFMGGVLAAAAATAARCFEL